MPALFTEGFFVREPAWHGMGIVLDEYPGREEAMRLAGHDFALDEVPVYRADPTHADDSEAPHMQVKGYKAIVKRQLRDAGECDASNGKVLHVVRDSYVAVDNEACWDIVDAIVGASENVKYETGITLEDGAKCAITFWLDEPGTVTGDDSPTYPYGGVTWAHDGTGSVKVLRTSIRMVCANTVSAAELQASRGQRDYTFRHTKNVMSKIEDAKMALAGISQAHSDFMILAEEIAQIHLTDAQRSLFISQFIPAPPEGVISERVMGNIDAERTKVSALLNTSPTIPDAHRNTGYGALMAATEYLDHLRGYRNANTYVGRTLLRPEPLKQKIIPLIREVAKA